MVVFKYPKSYLKYSQQNVHRLLSQDTGGDRWKSVYPCARRCYWFVRRAVICEIETLKCWAHNLAQWDPSLQIHWWCICISTPLLRIHLNLWKLPQKQIFPPPIFCGKMSAQLRRSLFYFYKLFSPDYLVREFSKLFGFSESAVAEQHRCFHATVASEMRPNQIWL